MERQKEKESKSRMDAETELAAPYCDRLQENNMWLISVFECVWSMNNISNFTEVPLFYNKNISLFIFLSK